MTTLPRRMIDHVNAALRRAAIAGATAHYVRSDDPCSDDAIEVRIAGVAASVSVQVGSHYLAVNRYLFENGQLDGVEELWSGSSFAIATERLVGAIRRAP